MFIPSTHTSASVDSGGAEGLPDNCLTDVGCNEERDTRAQAIALLEQLVQQQDNQTCNKQLKKQAGGLYWADSGWEPAVQNSCIGQNITTVTMSQSGFKCSDFLPVLTYFVCLPQKGTNVKEDILHKSQHVL